MESLVISFTSNIMTLFHTKPKSHIPHLLTISQPTSTSKTNTQPTIGHDPPHHQQIPLPVMVCNTLDGFIDNFIDRKPLRSSSDPKYVLADNFSPVDELPPTECTIIHGQIPSCLDGAYIRNGPNPQYLPRGGHHLFDGDGMLHCLCISNGKPTLCSRYVKTYRYTLEQGMGSSIMPRVFAGFDGVSGFASGAVLAARILTGQLNPINGSGLANTSLGFIGDRLMALGESDAPYVVRVTTEGDIETVGRWDFEGKLFMGMTAHPKKDPDTGEIFAFRYSPIPPFLTYFRIDPDGSKQEDVPIFSMLQPSFVHDFAVTKRYAIFPDMQIVMQPAGILAGNLPVGYDPGKVPRIGIIPRHATNESEMRWFQIPGLNFIHSINAWDESGGEEVVLIVANTTPIEHVLERMNLLHCSIEMIRVDLKSNRVILRRPLSTMNLEFGVINPDYLGRKNRYAYMAIGDPMPKFTGVVKLDLEKVGEGVVATRTFGEGCYGGEPFFVPKRHSHEIGEEDDGYLVSYVHDEKKDESRLVVMDAKSPTLEIVASIRLQQRVPYGFHGLFVSEEDLKKQRT